MSVTMPTDLEILQAARELVEKSWTQGAAARRADGEPTYALDPLATLWDADGAIERAVFQSQDLREDVERRRAYDRISLLVDDQIGGLMRMGDGEYRRPTLSDINARGLRNPAQLNVLDIIDRAIKKLEAEHAKV